MSVGIEIKYEKDVLTIEVNKAHLIANVRYDLSEVYGDEVSISNENKLIKSIIGILEQEIDESGKTLVHTMLAEAVLEVAEQGEEGIKFKYE